MDTDETWAELAREMRAPGFPELALRRTLDRWDLLGPRVVDVIERYARDPGAARDIGRNDPSPCGSGAKFKRCCMPA